MRNALGLLAGLVLLCGQSYPANAEPRKITPEEKRSCAEAYHKYCGEYGLDSTALRDCMDRNGRYLSHRCIDALVDAGEVSKSEVERRGKIGK